MRFFLLFRDTYPRCQFRGRHIKCHLLGALQPVYPTTPNTELQLYPGSSSLANAESIDKTIMSKPPKRHTQLTIRKSTPSQVNLQLITPTDPPPLFSLSKYRTILSHPEPEPSSHVFFFTTQPSISTSGSTSVPRSLSSKNLLPSNSCGR